MAKFYDLNLLLQEEQRILFGDDSLGKDGPTQYPATNLGSEKPFIGYTTISGYNTTFPGAGVTDIAAVTELVISTPVAGERATEDYHLVRYDQLSEVIAGSEQGDWQESVLSFETAPPPAPSDGERYIVEATASGTWTGSEDYIMTYNTASGTWEPTAPNEGMTTFVEDENKYYVYYDGDWAPMGEGIDHGDLIGLEGDDHLQYVPTDGSRGFTSTVSGVDPVDGSDLVTKDYVDSLTGPDDVVTLTGTQTITGDKTFDNTLTTFLGDVFFDGIEITMSGTTLNTEAGAVFNYDSTATINNDADNNYTTNSTINHENGATETYEVGSETVHESGSNDTYEDGSNLTYSGTTINNVGDTATYNGPDTTETNAGTVTNNGTSSTTNEAGSVTNYDDNSTINNNGDTNYSSTANITTSGTNIDYGDGTTVNYEDGTTETYEGGSETFHNSLSEDTYLPGSIVTFSGADVNFEGDTDIHYGSDTNTVNEGDTFYPAGSTVTFSGTTNFESDINFGSTTTSGLTLDFGDNTISGTGDIYAGNIYADNIVNVNQKWGRIACINGNRDQAVTFGTAWPDGDYTVVATLTNEVEAKPSIYSTIQGVKAGTGFTTHFSGKIDSSNFVLEWHAFYGQQN